MSISHIFRTSMAGARLGASAMNSIASHALNQAVDAMGGVGSLTSTEDTPRAIVAQQYNRALRDKRTMTPGAGRWVEYILPDLRRVYVESNTRRTYLGVMDDDKIVARVLIKPGATTFTNDVHSMLMMGMVEVSGSMRDVVRTADEVGLHVQDPETRGLGGVTGQIPIGQKAASVDKSAGSRGIKRLRRKGEIVPADSPQDLMQLTQKVLKTPSARQKNIDWNERAERNAERILKNPKAVESLSTSFITPRLLKELGSKAASMKISDIEKLAPTGEVASSETPKMELNTGSSSKNMQRNEVPVVNRSLPSSMGEAKKSRIEQRARKMKLLERAKASRMKTLQNIHGTQQRVDAMRQALRSMGKAK